MLRGPAKPGLSILLGAATISHSTCYATGVCERYTLTIGDPPRYNIPRGQLAIAATSSGEHQLRWGLLAPWRGHGGKRGPMIYETPRDAIATTPILRDASRKQRSLVLADGFYAWRTVGKKRIPYWIHPEPLRRIAFAGLVATHRDDSVASFAIVTLPATALVAPIAPTMPMIATDSWLASAEADGEPLDGWRADAVSTWVNDEAHDDPKCIAPLGNPAQGELF